MGKMFKIDSFIRESIRYEGLGARAYKLLDLFAPYSLKFIRSRHDAPCCKACWLYLF